MLAQLSDFKPDAHSVTPLYMQLANKLSSGITSGDWRANEALPSERMLSDMPPMAGLKNVPGSVEAELDIGGTALDPHVDMLFPRDREPRQHSDDRRRHQCPGSKPG